MVSFPVDNDFGGMIINCDKCQKNSYIKIKNPAETYIRDGGSKTEYWDNEIIKDEQILNQHINIKPLEQGIIVCDFFRKMSFLYSHNSRLPPLSHLERYFSMLSELHIVICTQPGSSHSRYL